MTVNTSTTDDVSCAEVLDLSLMNTSRIVAPHWSSIVQADYRRQRQLAEATVVVETDTEEQRFDKMVEMQLFLSAIKHPQVRKQMMGSYAVTHYQTVLDLSEDLYAHFLTLLTDWTSPLYGVTESDWLEFIGVVVSYSELSLPFVPTCRQAHQWSTVHSAGACRRCGVPNDQPRVFVRFQYRGQEVRFTCLPEELTALFQAPKWTSRLLADPINCLLLAGPFWDDLHRPAGVSSADIRGERIMRGLSEVKLLMRVLEIPPVTPAWVKHTIHSPCDADSCYYPDTIHTCALER